MMTQKKLTKQQKRLRLYHELVLDQVNEDLGKTEDVTLLDHFAGIALTGAAGALLPYEDFSPKAFASFAYEIAQAMIDERQKIFSRIFKECKLEADRQIEEDEANGENDEV